MEGDDVDFGSGVRIAFGLRLCLRRVLFQIGELKLKLFQDCAALRGLSELPLAQLRDRKLQLLDQEGVGLRFVVRRSSAGFGRDRALLSGGQRLALRRNGGARSGKRDRERIGSAWHAGNAATTPSAMPAPSTT